MTDSPDPNQNHYAKLARMYASAPTNRYYQPELTVGRGTAELIIPVREEFFHAGGAAHGSVYFKAADDAAFFAANSMVRDVFVLTASFHIHLLRPINSGSIRAVGSVVQYSTSLIVAEAVLYNDRDKVIARGSGDFARSKMKLSPDIGYR